MSSKYTETNLLSWRTKAIEATRRHATDKQQAQFYSIIALLSSKSHHDGPQFVFALTDLSHLAGIPASTVSLRISTLIQWGLVQRELVHNYPRDDYYVCTLTVDGHALRGVPSRG